MAISKSNDPLALTTALKKPKGPVTVVIDSSGLKIFGTGEWLHENLFADRACRPVLTGIPL